MPLFVITRHMIHVHASQMFPRYEIPTKTRFAVYCLLSLQSVSLFQMRPLRDADIDVQLLCIVLPAQLIWMALPLVFVLMFYSINDHSSNDANDQGPKYVDPSPPTSYTILLSMTLIHLGQIAIWTRTYLGSPPTFAKDISAIIQECTLHFAMSFWVISECEYIRAYWHSHLQEWPVTLITLLFSIPSANFDHDFLVYRDCFSYWWPCQYYMPPRDGWWSLEALLGVPLDIFYMISFTWAGMVCLLYPVKRFANPDPNGDTFTVKNEFMGVFFTPRSYWFIYLDFALQRPVRLVNRMLFELVAEGIKRALDQWRQRDLYGKTD